MTPEEHRFNALVLMFANLQRLMVFHNAIAVSEGREIDSQLREELTSRLDLVGGALQRSSENAAVSDADVDAVQPVADYLQREIRAYFETKLDGDLGAQAALGAGVVYAASYLNDGTVQMGQVFDRPHWVDREMQSKPMLITLRNRANAAVASAATGEVSAEVRGDIDYHVRVALGDRQLVLAQVDGLPTMLQGRDARENVGA
ncbi:hypothetical protein [Mycetocola zhujimingii]|uniref:hypothetical protein n=1 Tax=Mycetocola zhujimingii TaxID=2079792 RepID=UPI000D34CBAD|nr:hypothetical protein [Mycetocola zhujimingii]AWB86926.1 hypothetical protein C3E77_10065 [Mycetocola zhujimingii]